MYTGLNWLRTVSEKQYQLKKVTFIMDTFLWFVIDKTWLLLINFCKTVPQGWEYSAAMFIVVNTLALLFISCAYWRMHRIVRSSGLSLRSTQDRQDHALAQRFVVIVATDCFCWIPVISVKLAALAGMCLISGSDFAYEDLVFRNTFSTQSETEKMARNSSVSNDILWKNLD